MANEVRVDIEVRKEQIAKQKLKAVGDQAEKTGDQIEEMGDQATAAGKSSEKAGDKLKTTGDDIGHVNKRVIELSDSYKGLVAEFNRTGDTSLLKDLGKEKRQLRKFEGLAKDLLPKPADVAKEGMSLGSTLMGAVSAGAKAGGPYLTGVLVAAAALATPGIAATLGGAIIGGAGLGGIVGGVMLAAKDPRVEAAGHELGETLLGELQDSSRGFVEPVLRSLEKVGNAGWAAKLAPTFDKLAAKVDPLADGFIEAGDSIVGAFDRIGDTAGPVLDVLADGIPELADAFEDFIKSVTDDPEAAAQALELFIDAAGDAIRFAGDFIEVLIGIHGAAYDVAEALGIISEEERSFQRLTYATGGEIKNLVQHTEDAEQALYDFDDAMKEVFGRTLSVREATLRYEQSIDDLAEGIKNGSRSLKEETQNGRDNWDLIIGATKSIEENREARVRQGMSIEESNARYVDELESLRKQLIHLGYNKEAVNKYIAELKKVPIEAITEIHLKGIKAALADIKELSTALGAVAGYGIQAAISGPGHRASGGPVSAGQSYIVGENGPELLQMGSSSGHVFNASQTAAMTTSGASGGSSRIAAGGGMQVAVTVVGSDKLTQALAESLRFEVRTTAGGSAEEYFS